MARRYQCKKPLAEINVVPYIDVMLVLLIIFMITAPLLTQGVNVNLPHSSAKTLPPQKELPIIVSIDRLGNYYLNIAERPKQPMAIHPLITRVAAELQLAKQQHKNKMVYVKGDRDIDYGKVVAMMAMLQKSGIEQVGLITQPSNNN